MTHNKAIQTGKVIKHVTQNYKYAKILKRKTVVCEHGVKYVQWYVFITFPREL